MIYGQIAGHPMTRIFPNNALVIDTFGCSEAAEVISEDFSLYNCQSLGEAHTSISVCKKLWSVLNFINDHNVTYYCRPVG
jgi:hypothetical protein